MESQDKEQQCFAEEWQVQEAHEGPREVFHREKR
jgi:hypothetical protein